MHFRELSIPEKIQKARALVAHMEGNTYFPNPSPALPEIVAAADGLEQAYEDALNRGKIQIARMRQRDSVLGSLIVTLAAYVQSVSLGEGTIILSSGFDLQADRTQHVKAATPLNINGRTGAHEGEISLIWDRVHGAKAYNIQMSRDGVADWNYCGSSTKRQLVVGGLESGAKCFFRVAAVGAQGQSGWSDPGLGKAL